MIGGGCSAESLFKNPEAPSSPPQREDYYILSKIAIYLICILTYVFPTNKIACCFSLC